MGSPLSPMHHAVPTNGTATYVDDMEDQFEDALESHTHSSPSQQRRSTGDDSSLGLGLDGASSPFVASVDDQSQSSNQENHSPSKDKRRSRIMSGSEISPLKMLQRSSTDGPIPEADEKLAPPAPKSPRKSVSPMRRFPVKINNSIDSTARSRPQSMHAAPRDRQMSYSEDPSSPPTPPAATASTPTTNGTTTHQETEMTLEEAIAQNPGVKHAIEIFEDSISSIDDDDDDDDDDDNDSGLDGQGGTVKGPMDTPTPPSDSQDETAGDETMMSTFSNFSAIPNLTTFARLGGRTPTQMAREDPRRESNSTNLLDFTDNQRFPAGGRTSPTKNLSMADAKKTPQRQNIANLLDFDIPPMPTPRSLPSITARELESLKSNFMSEISGLRATLSGKDAEVVSLKTALGSAEKRAGETMEHLREERSLREQYSEEKDMWEKRGREMETVLRQVKEEIMKTSREREEFESKLEESEGRREAAEMMAQEAEARMASMRARESSAEARAEAAASPGGGVRSPGSRASQREIEIAVEKVARELHAAYKKKHEDKVAALKKTYEGRWDKKIRELEGRIGELAQENEELKLGRDATMTKVEFERAAVEEERKAQAIKDSAQIKELQAEVEKLEAVVRTVQDDNADLRQQLEGERVEKGELVTLAEELMQMQAQQQSAAAQQQQQIEQQLQEKQQQQQQRHEPPPQQQQHHAVPAVTPKRVPQRASAPPPARSNTTGGGGFSRPSTMTPKKAGGASPSGVPGTTKSGYRNSMIGRPGGGGGGLSGLKPPGASKIGGGGGVVGVAPAHGRTQSTTGGGGSGIGRPGSGLARPGGLMSSIQQMGSYRGGGRGE